MSVVSFMRKGIFCICACALAGCGAADAPSDDANWSFEPATQVTLVAATPVERFKALANGVRANQSTACVMLGRGGEHLGEQITHSIKFDLRKIDSLVGPSQGVVYYDFWDPTRRSLFRWKATYVLEEEKWVLLGTAVKRIAGPFGC